MGAEADLILIIVIIAIVALVLYLFYEYVIKPIISAVQGAENDVNGFFSFGWL